eukprot:9251343-Heterocapsa_arctica.AAC.1
MCIRDRYYAGYVEDLQNEGRYEKGPSRRVATLKQIMTTTEEEGGLKEDVQDVVYADDRVVH